MNYPIWDLGALGGGFWIALVAVTHVFVSHFAVGGGLWLVVTEHRARRRGDAQLLAYVQSHTWFFLLLTMVFGGLSGVGIWWTISLLNPAATSMLIHTFVFGWATEWVCFVGEIVALFIYHYKFATMRAREHLIIGWFYFAFAWLSLFLINGIIDFMLTPGRWLETANFWHGFFNPGFLPSLVFRTALGCMIAGMFGFLTAVWQKDATFRQRVVRYHAAWVLVPLVVLLPAAWWYLHALPRAQHDMVVHDAEEIGPYLRAFTWLTPLLVVGAVAMVLRLPRGLQRVVAVAVVVLGFLQMGSFEFIREAGRRPFVIRDVMYSNAITVADAARIGGGSILQEARWVSQREITPENRLAVGEELFRLECAACHSIGGPLNDILPLSAHFPQLGMEAQLAGQGKVLTYMPPFVGTAEERAALASYIVEGLHGKHESPAVEAAHVQAVTIPPFDEKNDEYVLLAWNNLGMHCLSDGDPWFVFLPPANDLHAQLIRRGETPEVVTDGVTITYDVEPGFEHPERSVRFWEFAKQNFGVELEPGVGLSGNRVNGTMVLDADHSLFAATMVPEVPYQNGHFNPYPLFTIEAHDAATHALLARTITVAPTSTEMGCMRCHGGGWRVDGLAGVTDATAQAVLAVHDRHSGTDLLASARRGEPRLCQSCHADPILNAEGKPELLNLAAAMHGWHANYLSGRGAEVCGYCHPASPAGSTRCLRGGHGGSLDCTSCHGTLEDHALALLKGEQERGKSSAARLVQHLQPRQVATYAEIHGRQPWINEPDCLTCHTEDYVRPDPATARAFNTWTDDASGLYRMRTDDSGLLQCEACHGSTHATYPTRNTLVDADRDNIQPLQYQGNRRPIGAGGNCRVCHTVDMEDAIHHPNMARTF